MRMMVLLFAAAVAASASALERVPLWPEGRIPDFQPHQVAAMTDEAGRPDFKADEHRMPFVEWYDAPKSPNGACMVLVSGGSYQSCCDVGMVADWSRRLGELGFQCVKLVYRTPRPNGVEIWRTAWEDGQRALRLVRSQAKDRGFDPERIGVMSMSAGSHLATLLATSSQTPAYAKVDALDDVPCHANWVCAFAIAYGVTDGLGGPNERAGDAPDAKLDDCFKFDARTCPMCLCHGGADEYSPRSSTLVYRRLREKKVPAELHLFADRGHGCHGFDRAVEFMRQMGFLGPVPPEEKIFDRFPDDSARAGCEKQGLWPKGRTPDRQEKQGEPYIEWHTPRELRTKAIQIVYSGGCYEFNGPDSFEVKPVRRYLNAKGMTVVTMRYRTPRPAGLAKHTTAWQDLQRAVRLVRSQAKARGLDPDRIGIMGSSAGGHLTLMGATSSRHPSYLPVDDIDRLPCNANWAVAIYPAYALTDGMEEPNKTGGNADSAMPAPEFSFDLATCPTLFIHGDADGWAAMNSVKFWEQMRRMGVQGELHTLARRGHCFMEKSSPGTGSYTWMDRIWEFMSAKGFNR